jgi:type II secretory pathway pseudopilin PulG
MIKISNFKFQILNLRGFTLVETLVAAGLLVIVFIGLFTAFQSGMKILIENKSRSTAIALANEKMEFIRNLSYEKIGTIGGIPPGDLPQKENKTLNRVNFVLKTFIQYIDDPADGLGSQDENGITADYKKVRIEVVWQGRGREKSVVLISNFSPPGIETITGGGTLIINVLDASLNPVGQAEVKIENSKVSPPISLTTLTNDQGKVIFPGSPAADSYKITVTKTNYSTSQTYDTTPQNPNPNPGHLTILEGETTEATFFIDRLGSKSVDTFLYSEESPLPKLPNLDFQMRGEKTIGKDAQGNSIYKYSKNLTTDNNGHLDIPNLEWDTYTIAVSAATGYDIMESCPPQPVNLSPGGSILTTLTLITHSTNTLLVLVKDGDGELISGANVRLFNQGLDYSKTITSTTCGQAFFGSLVQSSDYSLEVTKAGYQNYLLENISISGQKNLTVILNRP